jgi:hypothetical protein
MKKTFLILGSILTLSACSVFNKNTEDWAVDSTVVDTAVAVGWLGDNEILPSDYRAARYSDWDLQHTNLYVSFDFAKKQLNGDAEITMKLHFYETDSIVLDAKKMDIESVQIKHNGNWQTANFTYPDSLILVIKPGITFTSANPIANLRIKYTAKPYAAEVEGGSAITQDRGLYFINPDGSDPLKPRQIWTQGETESNSRWFPTIDAPNQKMTQRICMTVPDSMVSLSNGLKISSQKNSDRTRTDCWEQKLPHAPYLAMMAIGDWAEIQDKWRDKPVTYLVEKPYASRAKQIFGKTPEMMEFFSTYTGVDFPWDKYSQVVVRDFVSGAMENTSATVHMEALQTTAAEYLDNSYEDYVSHELFHHWFGDLVTAESWSNITLNESFATYGEYLWREHKYGKEYADELLEEFRLYTRLNNIWGGGHKKLVRYNYHRADEVFDVVSYQKGALILHMLRHEIGDAAFKEGIKKYLTDNRFRAAEVDHLRLAMEAVTGRDLHPFFNQWYFTEKHPNLNLNHTWDESNQTLEVMITQTQSHRNTYLLKPSLQILYGNNSQILPLNIDKREQTFIFQLPQKPDFVILDSEQRLLCDVNYPSDETETSTQFLNALQTFKNPTTQRVVFNRFIRQIPDSGAISAIADSMVFVALNSNWSPLMKDALDYCNYHSVYDSITLKNYLTRISLGNYDSDVREKAMRTLRSLFPQLGNKILPYLTNDISPKVATYAINYTNWEPHYGDTARNAVKNATKAIAVEWLKKWMQHDTGLQPLAYMLLIHKNPEAGLDAFARIFSNWFLVNMMNDIENSSELLKTIQMDFMAKQLSSAENKTLRTIAAGIMKPVLDEFPTESKPAWFSVAEKLVKTSVE